jgi:Zn-dependent protease
MWAPSGPLAPLWLALLAAGATLPAGAQGSVSLRFGDPTARDAGRLSLNPLRHVDLFGTVLLPLLLWSAGAPVFGYAKPVPVNPIHYPDLRHGQLATGLAGPAANLALALAGAGIARAAWLLGAADGGPTAWLWLVAAAFTQVNLVLMFFNLIPFPPLDGSSVLPLFLSNRGLYLYYRLPRYAFPVLIAILWGVPALFQIDPIGTYFRYTVDPTFNLLVPRLPEATALIRPTRSSAWRSGRHGAASGLQLHKADDVRTIVNLAGM